ncbi:hypothetical protein ACHAPT_009401 [Fusarium lateritium]
MSSERGTMDNSHADTEEITDSRAASVPASVSNSSPAKGSKQEREDLKADDKGGIDEEMADRSDNSDAEDEQDTASFTE